MYKLSRDVEFYAGSKQKLLLLDDAHSLVMCVRSFIAINRWTKGKLSGQKSKEREAGLWNWIKFFPYSRWLERASYSNVFYQSCGFCSPLMVYSRWSPIWTDDQAKLMCPSSSIQCIAQWYHHLIYYYIVIERFSLCLSVLIIRHYGG